MNWLLERKANPQAALVAGRADRLRCSEPQTAAETFHLSAIEEERFLRLISQSLRIRRHRQLFQLMQGEVQFFIPHQVLIAAWGDFRGPDLKFDVISAIPGVRTQQLCGCDNTNVLKTLHMLWLAHERQPFLLDRAGTSRLIHRGGDSALFSVLQGMDSILVHGVHDARERADNLYVAANANSILNGGGFDRFRLLVDPVIAQIDLAFRKVAAFQDSQPGSYLLSEREEEILILISDGRTNREIAETRGISAFTVKNHVQHIIKKLGAANRTEAAAKYRQLGRQFRRNALPIRAAGAAA